MRHDALFDLVIIVLIFSGYIYFKRQMKKRSIAPNDKFICYFVALYYGLCLAGSLICTPSSQEAFLTIGATFILWAIELGMALVNLYSPKKRLAVFSWLILLLLIVMIIIMLSSAITYDICLFACLCLGGIDNSIPLRLSSHEKM